MKTTFYSICFLILVFSTQIKSHKSNENKNLRKMDELSEDIVILHLNDVHCGVNDTLGYDGFVLYLEELKKNINIL